MTHLDAEGLGELHLELVLRLDDLVHVLLGGETELLPAAAGLDAHGLGEAVDGRPAPQLPYGLHTGLVQGKNGEPHLLIVDLPDALALSPPRPLAPRFLGPSLAHGYLQLWLLENTPLHDCDQTG